MDAKAKRLKAMNMNMIGMGPTGAPLFRSCIARFVRVCSPQF